MITKEIADKILKYDKKLLKFWITMYAGCSYPEYFDAKKGTVGLELQQVPVEYVELLLWFKEQKFESYLELGVGRGGSFLLNCLFQPNLKYADCVDNSVYWKDDQNKDIHEKVTWLNQNNKECGYAFYDYNTDEYFNRLEKDKMFDCIFIDADHSYDGVKKDYDNALKHINDGGYIIFHDIASVQCPGVMQIWKEVREQFKDCEYKEFVYGVNCGIGLLQIKNPELYGSELTKLHFKYLSTISSPEEFYNIEGVGKPNVKSVTLIGNNAPSTQFKKGLVIIETRPNAGLVETINNHLKYLGEDWGVHVFCSEDNRKELMSKHLDCFNSIQYSILKHKDLNEFRYNRLLTSPMFWDSLPYDKVFIAQTDGFMRRTGINEFMGFDYIGAAWAWNKNEIGHGGNGGESLRTVSVMREICDKFIWQPTDGNCDVFFVNCMNNHKIGKVADLKDCIKFGCETIYSENPLCCHAIDKYLTKEQCRSLRQ